MRKFLHALCVSTLSAAVVTATSAGEFTAKDLANEEGKFAAYSVKNGMRAAFLEFFAARSWLLRPDLVDAQAWIRGRPDPPIVLDWKSQSTILSASGDLGFSTGPSIYRSKADPKAPAAHGQFFSIWQKQKNGEWKVLIDHGISHGPTNTPDTLPTTPFMTLDLTKQKSAEPFDDAEKAFVAHTLKVGLPVAYADRITNHTVLLRDGQFPIRGKAAVINYLNSQGEAWSWTPKLQGTSEANDFSYAVGSVAGKTQKGEQRKGQYVRVLVRDASGEPLTRWTLAAEILTLEPPSKQ